MPNTFMFQVGTPEERAWMKQGSCLGMDPEIFHPEEDDPDFELKVHIAKQVCGDCVVTDNCLDWAMTRKEPLGIWGQLTDRERKRIRMKRKR